MSNSYLIDNTSGTISFIVEPGTLDGPGGVNRNSDLYLYGQGSILWGEGIAENQLRLAESFACPQKELGDFLPGGTVGNTDYDPTLHDVMPKNEADLGAVGLGVTVPVDGQLWYNTTTKILYTYDLVNTTWRTSSGLSIDSEPASPVTADMKYDSDYHGAGVPQLTIYTGAAFESIAHEYVELAGTDTGIRVQPMTGLLTLSGDPVDNLHPVTKQFGEATYLDLDGSDTMTGALDMGTNLINNIVNPVAQQDAMTLNYADATYFDIDGSDTMTGALDMGTNLINNVVDPVSPQDAATQNYVLTLMQTMLNNLHPIGSIMVGPTDPAAAFTAIGLGTTWSQVAVGTFLMAEGDGSQGAAGSGGGANTKTLSLSEMPSHNHGGGSHTHTYAYSGTHTNNDIGIMGGGAAPRGIIVNSWGTRNTGPASATLSTQGSNASWDKRPQYQVAQMWKRTS